MANNRGTDAQAVPFDHDGFVPCVQDALVVAYRIGALYVSQGKGWLSRRIAVARCDCGAHVGCWNLWTNPCASGTEYTGEGDRLLPREYWGEEAWRAFQASQELDRKARVDRGQEARTAPRETKRP